MIDNDKNTSNNSNNNSIYFIQLFLKRKKTVIVYGNISHIDYFIKKLFKSKDQDAFLVIKEFETNNFLQMKYYEKTIELDFPMITSNQKENENKIAEISNNFNLNIKENFSTDGNDKFIDIYLNKHIEENINIVKEYLLILFEITNETKLEIELYS